MPDKRMRPIVKQEPGADGAQELPPQQQQAAAAAAAGEREGRRRRSDMGEKGAGTELEMQLLVANAKAQAFALQGMERERALGEELLQAKAQVAELRAEIRINDAALEAKVAIHKAEVALLETKLQSKEAALATRALAGSATLAGNATLAGSAMMLRVKDMCKVKQFYKLMRTRLAGKRYRLLYTWSRDGRSNGSFHRHCDKQVRLRMTRIFVSHEFARHNAVCAGANACRRAVYLGTYVWRLCQQVMGFPARSWS
jgi:hypothetical protein